MRRYRADHETGLPSLGLSYVNAGSQDSQSLQSTIYAHDSAGRALYLPFEGQYHASQHPCSSRLHTTQGRHGSRAHHAVSANNHTFQDGLAAQQYKQSASEPLQYPHHQGYDCRVSQGRFPAPAMSV